MRRTALVILLVIAVAYRLSQPSGIFGHRRAGSAAPPTAVVAGTSDVAQAYADHRSRVEVHGSGVIDRVLADETGNGTHQRFILRADSGQSILFAHNIDIAGRIPNLRAGENIEFLGEYEWNDRGGVVHWTHHDPSGRHADGWIKYLGALYR